MITRTSLKDLVRAGHLYFSDGYRTKRSELADSGYRILRVADVQDGSISLSGPDFVDPAYSQAIGEKAARPGDILLTTKGTIGRIAVTPSLSQQRVVYSPQLCFFRVSKSGTITPQFLKFWLKSPEARGQMGVYGGNTDMAPYLNLKDIGGMEITLPPLAEQERIGEVLGTLDDKIAANRAAVESAGQLQNALWQTTRSDVALAPLSRFVSPKLGGTPPRRDAAAWDGSVPWASVKDMTAAPGGVILQTTEHISTTASSSAPRLHAHPVGSVFMSARGTVGHVTTNAIPCAINQSAYAFIPSAEYRTSCRLALQDAVAILQAHAHGSVFSTITMRDLRGLQVPDLMAPSIAATEHKLAQLEAMRVAFLKENTTLAATRDELLPLLMSGKITVKDAEKRVEEEV